MTDVTDTAMTSQTMGNNRDGNSRVQVVNGCSFLRQHLTPSENTSSAGF